jgi:hypothetical protein
MKSISFIQHHTYKQHIWAPKVVVEAFINDLSTLQRWKITHYNEEEERWGSYNLIQKNIIESLSDSMDSLS